MYYVCMCVCMCVCIMYYVCVYVCVCMCVCIMHVLRMCVCIMYVLCMYYVCVYVLCMYVLCMYYVSKDNVCIMYSRWKRTNSENKHVIFLSYFLILREKKLETYQRWGHILKNSRIWLHHCIFLGRYLLFTMWRHRRCQVLKIFLILVHHRISQSQISLNTDFQLPSPFSSSWSCKPIRA